MVVMCDVSPYYINLSITGMVNMEMACKESIGNEVAGKEIASKKLQVKYYYTCNFLRLLKEP